MKSKRHTHWMHVGRVSRPQACYFITVCTSGRKTGLTPADIAPELHLAWDALQEDGDLEILCRTIMPDHVHVLLCLQGRLTIGQVIGKWKVRTRAILKKHKLAWQRDFFERKLRPADQEAIGHYIFLNPYAAGLVGLDETSPHWKLDQPKAFAFPSMLREGLYPHPEWLKQNAEWQKIRGW